MLKTDEAKERKLARHRERYYELKARGICVVCGCADATMGTVCEVCYEKKCETLERNRDKYLEQHRKANHKRYVTLANMRCCVKCGKKLDETIKGLRCEKCAEKHRRENRLWRKKNSNTMTYDDCIKTSTCVTCRKEKMLPGRRVCSKCLAKLQEHMNTIRKRGNFDGEIQ